MRRRGDQRPVKFIFVDTPTGQADVYKGLAGNLFSRLPLGERSNRFAPQVWGAFFTPADLNQIHPHDVAQLEALWEVMRTYPLTGIRDEYGYITRHSTPVPVDNSRAVFVQSTNDVVVKPRAYSSWQRHSFPNLPLLRVNCTHGSLLDEPDLYTQRFIEALRILGIV